MQTIKITIFLRTPQAVWSYKERTSRDFWADVTEALSQRVAPARLEHEAKGTFQHQFTLRSEKETDFFRTLTNQVVASLLGEEDPFPVVVSVTQPEEGCAQPEDRPPHKQPSTADAIRAGMDTQPEAETAQERACPVLQEDRSLCGQAQKIKALKDGLLAKIRGQRHAVDEVTQSIFECEMFTAHNKKRKGPLATFLFTGPSGVGKTFLAEQCGELLGRKTLVVDMSEYSDNLANGKFNGDHGQAAIVTGFVRQNPNGIIVFDEVEKAHINTIHLFLQILDGARLMDHQIKKEVSFRDNIIIMTTNAGKDLYDDSTVCDLSATPRSVILEALRTDRNPQNGECYFPECITTRMANGHVLLFNHLEPFSLMEIIRDEIALQIGLFEEASGVKVEYDPRLLAALVLYNGGGVSDARTLRGLARNILVRELQEIVMQIYSHHPEQVNELKNITITVDTDSEQGVNDLFVSRDKMFAAVFSTRTADSFGSSLENVNAQFEFLCDPEQFKRRVRGVTDFVLIDPLCGAADMERLPNDIEDICSDGMRMFDYMRELSPETPVYILDSEPQTGRSFDSLLAKGAKGVVRCCVGEEAAFVDAMKQVSFNALINNSVYSLGRSGKFLDFNCAQYLISPSSAVLSAEKLKLRSAPRAGDNTSIAQKGENNDLRFADIIGCKSAKETLSEYCSALDNPRQTALSNRRMPKGVLLYGPPGTGKTMLAKAMANECNATFIPVSATSFFGSLVGETERNIRDVFKKARRYAPAIIFVDEVDAIGRKRTGSSSTSHNEDALNTFLAEMDGFSSDDKRPVFVLAATNYGLDDDGGRVLDPAFVRRFDSKILIPLPDTDARYEFIVKCLKKHSIHFGADHETILRNMAERTGGMSNADLEMMHAQFVRALGDAEPDRALYMNTLDTFRFGDVNKMDPDHLRQTACHEAGHALVCRLCGVTPTFLTVVSRGNFGGFMESAGENKTGTYSFDQLMDLVCRCLAGRAAEIEVYGSSKGTNTGASSDIQKARRFVQASLQDYAMGKQMFLKDEDYAQAEALIQQQYARAQQMLRENRNVLDALTELLTTQKSLDQGQLSTFFAEHNI